MCTNKTKKWNKAFSYLFRTHLSITVSAIVSGRLGAMSRMEVFFIRYELHINGLDSIIEVFYHLNKVLIATKHVADNNFVF